ncbi:MAG: preprotein translocase subunit SecG, partial [Flavobacteriales bacterium]
IISLLLALVVLVQNPKGGGLATGFQGATQVGGVQRTADFLEKATWYLGIGLFVLCLISARWYTSSTIVEGGDEPAATEQTSEQPAEEAPAEGQ